MLPHLPTLPALPACLLLYLCTEPKVSSWTEDMDKRIYKGIQVGRRRNFIKTGDPLIIVTGWRTGAGFTNTMRIVNTPEKDGDPIIGTPAIADDE